jgi:hypothetical protein
LGRFPSPQPNSLSTQPAHNRAQLKVTARRDPLASHFLVAGSCMCIVPPRLATSMWVPPVGSISSLKPQQNSTIGDTDSHCRWIFRPGRSHLGYKNQTMALELHRGTGCETVALGQGKEPRGWPNFLAEIQLGRGSDSCRWPTLPRPRCR